MIANRYVCAKRLYSVLLQTTRVKTTAIPDSYCLCLIERLKRSCLIKTYSIVAGGFGVRSYRQPVDAGIFTIRSQRRFSFARAAFVTDALAAIDALRHIGPRLMRPTLSAYFVPLCP